MNSPKKSKNFTRKNKGINMTPYEKQSFCITAALAAVIVLVCTLLTGCETLRNADPDWITAVAEKAVQMLSKL
jgi:hypothetical protein